MTTNYDLFREFADSWALLIMVLLFVFIILFTLRPSSTGLHRNMASMPFRNDKEPKNFDKKVGGAE